MITTNMHWPMLPDEDEPIIEETNEETTNGQHTFTRNNYTR
jgi:hypothetical protein